MESIIHKSDSYCFLCHYKIGCDVHHIFGGPNRKLSDQDGLTVKLCRECHHSVHNGPKMVENQDKLHKIGQRAWEATYGTREEFMRRYGRNWL